ncbi:glycosyltransferase [Gordonia phage Forza]|uniref:Glycosyltransferase n=1 Tax=Gordonia phage Forza TaxID=2571247 RepID=A0A650EYJ5_9CAUD|nr:glycosyltransferase [Gordonia phage Forza]QEM41594.1 glycosyltransferase [Gordonia phage Boopy]QGT55120.1 glycosyltransferase [Gordonia phage Forza]UXE04268.1 glycosyltransferase [Gordonia phage BlueNGold]WBF03908.1 glycosyltransferase [Gordonia phage Mareelih]
MKIAALAVTPKWHGGVETAFKYTVEGLRELDHDVDVIGCVYRKYKSADDFKARSGWREQAHELIDTKYVIKSFDGLERALTNYDALIPSELNFADKYTPEVLLKSEKIAPWISGWHTNMVRKSMEGWHQANEKSPRWTHKYLSFWNSAQEVHPTATWYQSMLPYRVNQDLNLLKPDERKYDFIMTTRVDPRKGVVTYLAGLEGLARRGYKGVLARLAGTPIDFPGGPYSYGMSQLLRGWGWTVTYETDKMKSNWRAEKNGNVIDYTGNYEPSELDAILMSGRYFVNATSGKAANSHFEYSTLEAINAGCVPLVKADWDPYQYNADSGLPNVIDLPEKSYRIRKGNRIVYNDTTVDAVEKTYDEFTDVLEKVLTEKIVDNWDAEWNRRVISRAHDPQRIATDFTQAITDWYAER